MLMTSCYSHCNCNVVTAMLWFEGSSEWCTRVPDERYFDMFASLTEKKKRGCFPSLLSVLTLGPEYAQVEVIVIGLKT